jgi:Flp pilus assembly protein TadD
MSRHCASTRIRISVFCLWPAVMLMAGCATNSPPLTDSHPDTQPAPTAAVVTVQVDAEAAFRSAVAAMQNEDWHDAIELLQTITTQHPQYPGAWVNLGIAEVQLGDATRAEQAFRHALELDAQQAEAWNQLGMLYRRRQQPELARDAWLQALAARPDYADAHWNLAVLYDRYLPDPVQALAHYTQYQALTRSEDPQLAQWIVTLEAMQPAAPASQTAGVTRP